MLKVSEISHRLETQDLNWSMLTSFYQPPVTAFCWNLFEKSLQDFKKLMKKHIAFSLLSVVRSEN